MSGKPAVIKTDFPFSVFSLEADTDYLLARHISFVGAGFTSRAGFFGQQACEKYMKALSVQERRAYLQTHKLLLLSDFCVDIDPFFARADTKETLRVFDLFDQLGRYGAAAKYDPLAPKDSTLSVAGVRVWHEEYRDRLDAFVFYVRGKLKFEGNFSDSLKAILERNRKDILMGTWTGRPPLRVILTKNNRAFSGYE